VSPELKTWVEEVCGTSWLDPAEVCRELEDARVSGPRTIVHGDLHSQNIVIDAETRETWPIDFGWTHELGSPLVDLTMLECSMKFHAIPEGADLRSLIVIDREFFNSPMPSPSVGRIPYGAQVSNVFAAVRTVREIALESMGFTFEDCRRALWLMTYSHSTSDGLNRPAVLASLQVMSSELKND
jgi:Ternary complex associated domain 9